jgi:hypothetical protein
MGSNFSLLLFTLLFNGYQGIFLQGIKQLEHEAERISI